MFSTKKCQDSLGKWQIPVWGQEVQKLSLDFLCLKVVALSATSGVVSLPDSLKGLPPITVERGVQFEYQRQE